MSVFAALADPTRRRIVELLAKSELSAGEIAGSFSISAPAVSQHLKILREARLVQARVDAQKRFYAPDPEGLAEVEAWLQNLRGFWNPRLDRLEASLRQAATKKQRESKGAHKSGRKRK
ncbi:MAG: metalloregulator ArsR/SmtB family transcription factor [bacterium]|nr:metalloregulator ArsR/SmtB family transcription factor [bacterium]